MLGGICIVGGGYAAGNIETISDVLISGMSLGIGVANTLAGYTLIMRGE